MNIHKFAFAVLLAGCTSTPLPPVVSVNGPNDRPAAPPADAPLAREPAITAETHFAAGQVAESQSNPAGAIAQYNDALAIKKDHLGSLYRLGILYSELKQYPQAISMWERYVQATGETATAYADLAFCDELASQPDKAQAAYLAGIARDAKNVPCRVNYGLMLGRRGKINDAVAQWRFVLSDAEVHYNLGSLYESQGHKEQARLEYTKSLQLDPKLTDAQSRVVELDR